jgi:hypothetical protein
MARQPVRRIVMHLIPLTPRTVALLEMRHASALSKEWVFPAGTNSGHIEKSTLRKQHPMVCKLASSFALSALHFPPHLLDTMGGLHGPVRPGLPRQSQRLFYDPSTRSSAGHTVLKVIERARKGKVNTVLGTLANVS